MTTKEKFVLKIRCFELSDFTTVDYFDLRVFESENFSNNKKYEKTRNFVSLVFVSTFFSDPLVLNWH